MAKRPIDYDAMATELAAHADYKVLRRLRGLSPHRSAKTDDKVLRGFYVDAETTGLDLDRDEIIEFGGIPFEFTSDGTVLSLGDRVHGYKEPKGRELTPEITAITGITADMIAGKELPGEAYTKINEAHLVISHNAAFDRPIIERDMSSGSEVCWGCSMDQVPWADFGISGRRLEYLLMSLGYFYKAHNALSDCEAGLFALLQEYNGKTGLAYVLEASRKTTHRIWAVGSPYESKDRLKERKYYWNPGDDGRPKAWNKIVNDAELPVELRWLADHARCRNPRVDQITAFNRYSKRGG